ncbi:sodium:solute symporter family protein [Thermovenabulum gondwanense]|uniref:Sodium/pantothenate symporter n=1 Tax=Thermovenabulum gondwanense TaxID=520767 RepID=A0A162MQW3_9FIRM|nr:sodium:solute symporter family protein [Thermovenabulum gondwanense]KYO66972.1 Sodium/pantothenate symporter [Thermovenabulum gondwanense]
MVKSFLFMSFFFIYTILIVYSTRSGFYDTYNVEDFFLAGKKLNTFYSTGTFIATWFSAASILGLGSYLYIYGISAVFYSILPWFFGAVLLYFLSKTIRKSNIHTFPEFFQEKYNSQLLQKSSSIIMIISYVFYITMQIKGFGMVMSMLLDIPYSLSLLLVYLYIFYTTFGGLFSVVKSDALNAAVIFVSLFIFAVYIIKLNKGLANLYINALNVDTPPLLIWNISTPRGGLLDPFCKGLRPPLYLLSSFFGWGLGLAANPQYIIRIVSAKSDKTAKNMIVYSLIILSVIYFFVIFGSIGLRVLIPIFVDSSNKNIDDIVPLLFNRIAPSWITGVFLIGIIAASVSTANSELLLISTSFWNDLLKRFYKNIGDEDKILNINRILIGIAGTVSMILSLNPPENLIEYGGNIWGIFSSSIFVPLYATMFIKKPKKLSAEISFFSGLITYMLFFILQNRANIPYIKLIHPGMPGFIVSLAGFIVGEVKKHEKH